MYQIIGINRQHGKHIWLDILTGGEKKVIKKPYSEGMRLFNQKRGDMVSTPQELDEIIGSAIRYRWYNRLIDYLIRVAKGQLNPKPYQRTQEIEVIHKGANE